MNLSKGALIGLLLSLQLLGCSKSQVQTDPETSPNQPTPSPSVRAQNSPSGTTTGAESSTSDKTSRAVSPREVSEKLAEPHLTMNLKQGVEPHFNNGPSSHEIEKYRKRLSRKPKNRNWNRSGQTAPVFDSEMEEVNI